MSDRLPHGHRLRKADHEAGHFVCMRVNFGARHKIFTISIKEGDEFAGYSMKEIKPQKGEGPLLVEPFLGGIAAEALGIHLYETGNRDAGISLEEFKGAMPSLFEMMKEFGPNSGGTDLKGLVELRHLAFEEKGVPYDKNERIPTIEELKKESVKTLAMVWTHWMWIKKVSDALLIHTVITNETYEELVGPLPP